MTKRMRGIWEKHLDVLGRRFPVDCGKGGLSRAYFSYIKIREFLRKNWQNG